MASEYDYYLKLMLIGDCKVGKSSICTRYKDDTFRDDYIATIGVDLNVKSVEVNSKKVKLSMWDSSGTEKASHRSLHIHPQYQYMQGFIIVYDVNDRNSFEHLNDYLNWIQQYGKQHEVKVIVGNKLDDSSNRAVTVDEAKEFAAAQGCPYYEVSAKTGENVTQLFTDVLQKLTSK